MVKLNMLYTRIILLTGKGAGGSRVTRYDLDMFISEREKKYLLLYFPFMIQVMCIWSSFSHRSMKAYFLFIEREGKISKF